jgi:hypothetical protein
MHYLELISSLTKPCIKMNAIKPDLSGILQMFLLVGLVSACGEDHYSEEDFLLVKKIDTHIHINSESTAFAKQAQNDNFFLVTVNVDAPHYPKLEEQSRIATQQIASAPSHIAFLTTFGIERWDSATWTKETIAKLERDFNNGSLGVKIWKNIGMVNKDSSGNFIMINHPRFDSVIAFIESKNKTLLAHLGDPKNCWLPVEEMTVNNDRNYYKSHPEYHMYLHKDFPSYEEQIKARDEFLKKHPNLKFVGAHLGSLEWSVDELAKRLDRFPNMAVDMAARIPHFQHQSMTDYEKVRDFIIKYQDRLIYATDSGISASSDPEKTRSQLHETWMRDWKYFVTDSEMTSDNVDGKFKGLYLPKKVVDKIYRLNALKWFNIPQ